LDQINKRGGEYFSEQGQREKKTDGEKGKIASAVRKNKTRGGRGENLAEVQ